MVPVPVISFDNVLPALAIVLMTWGDCALRDGPDADGGLPGHLSRSGVGGSAVVGWLSAGH
jgi:hypothetical protein